MRAPNDPDYGHHDSRTPPTAQLVYAIIAQAVQDLFGSPGSNLTASQCSNARRDALKFLTASSGSWAQWRRTYCDLVGLDDEILRARIVAVLEGGDAPVLAYGVGKNPAGLKEARDMWASPRPAPKLTAATKPKAIPKPAPQPTAPKPAAPPRPPAQITTYSDVRRIVHGLLHKPNSFRDLIIATQGNVSDSTIRTVLRNGLETRELGRDARGRYLLRAA